MTRVLSPPGLVGGFVYHRPASADAVDDLLDSLGGAARLLAGGTDLLVQMRSGGSPVEHVIDLVDLGGLDEVREDGSDLHIGATVSMWSLTEHPVVRRRFASVADAARCVGSRQIQARATLAGNICNASPAADTAPALLLYDADVELRAATGRRRVPLAEFWRGPRRTLLSPGEWVERITLHDPGRHGSAYVKLGRSRGVDLALVGVAVLVTGAETRIAACAVAPTVRRLVIAEREISDWGDDATVDRSIGASISPISDIRAGADYRRAMTVVCCRRARKEAIRRRDKAVDAR
jgi:carbon-monoxide dehydrogenase medium subunit